MKRRNFLTGSTMATLGLLAGGSKLNAMGLNSAQKDSSACCTDLLNEKILKGLLKDYNYHLFEDFLPFVEKHAVDHKYGGFLCHTNRKGENITQDKTAWFEGRGIWVFSFLYNNLKKDPKYLEIARKSVEFILKNEPTGKVLWSNKYSREGKPLEGPATEIYGDLFIANGFSEYSVASGEAKYWDKAKSILLKCWDIYNSPDYDYLVTYGPDVRNAKGSRILGHYMILIRLVTQMLNHRPDPELEKIADKCIDDIMNYHFNPEFSMLNEVINFDLSRQEGPFAQFVYTGHSIETLWMLMFEADRRNDQKLLDLLIERFKRHIEVAEDNVYDGYYRALVNVNENIWKLDKALWVQEEVLVGLLFIAQKRGYKWAEEKFLKQWNYVIDKFPLKQYGYPMWNIYGDRYVTFVEDYDRIGHFHHPRHLMLNILRIKEMLAV